MSINLFDVNFYRAANTDLAGLNDAQLQSHFQQFGLNEGRRFSAFIDLNLYRASNSDLAGFSDRQAYEHLSNYGVREGRKFSPVVDLNYYRGKNSDLKNFNNEQLFGHLQSFGVAEGRQFSPLVDLKFYRSVNGDLASFNNNQALQHLEIYGVGEGRRFSAFVDLNLYRAANPDLFAIGFDNHQLLEHLASYGVSEGRRFSISFDSNYYRGIYSDLAQAGFNNAQLLEHFEDYGLTEGRTSSESFDINYYLANNADLKAANFNKQQAQQHFEIYGYRENRLSTSSSSISLPANRDDNSLDTASNLGVLIGSRNFTNQFVGTTDANDYYRFTLAQTSNFSLSLSGVTQFADVELIYDNNGNQVQDYDDRLTSTTAYSSSNGSINKTLGAGTYFIRVSPDYSSYNTNYTLGVSATPYPVTTPKDPGNTLGTALDIGTVSTNRSFTDFVGSADRNDYYRFNLSQTSNFNLSLSGVSDFADVQLIYDSNGNGVVDYSDELGSTSAYSSSNSSINKTLGAGTYFIRVSPDYSSYNTNYTLAVSATSYAATTPKDPGNTLGTALDIGFLSGTRSFKDFVGSVDSEDWYRFSLSSSRNFKLDLIGLSNDADVELIYDSNGNGQYDYYEELYSSYNSGSSNETISATLGAGTYFVRVNTDYSDDNTGYILTLLA
ncbi:PPC domain-containing protein [Tolypothrix sp. VBCCA 56010]|uniref:PPC domain-containing protein n=1 Tax=Tolypothrix sp. VBCCA 56010 TaxID=3137731 RepID=UPI003D7E594D